MMTVMLYLTETHREGFTQHVMIEMYLTETRREGFTQHVMIVMLYLTETRREGGHSTCDDCNVCYRDP